MAMMFGRFEIQSEISKSETALIYKALDTETNQVVALKTQSLAPLGERASAFVDTLIAEGEHTRDLASQNIVVLYGAGEIDGQFCAAMEYIQGNSVATMIARKEGFSIWDLLDITRQVCAALDKAAVHSVVHSSLEPAKILVQWDGLVKVLGYGISNMGLIAAESGNGLGKLMPYCSPEQIRGEATDGRSNLYTVGVILYEMVTNRKAFDSADPVALVGQIENEMPSPPAVVNPKIQPAVSALIMKALAKDPAERYQTARELTEDLEKCKDNGRKAPAESKKPAVTTAVKVDPASRAAAAAKFVSAVASATAASTPARPAPPKAVSGPSISPEPVLDQPVPRRSVSTNPPASSRQADQGIPRVAKAAAAAAGQSSGAGAISSRASLPSAEYGSPTSTNPGTRSLEKLESEPEAGTVEDAPAPSSVLSAGTLEQEAETQSPNIAVDPMMSGGAVGQAGASFSDIEELPPLKEPVFTPPPPPEPEPAPRPVVQQVYPKQFYPKEEKPKIQPREVADKAIQQIVTIPPRLMLFSILGAVAVILVVAVSLFLHVRSEDDGSTAAPQPVKAVSKPEATPAPVAEAAPAPVPAPPIVEEQPTVTIRQIEKHSAKSRRPAPPPPVVIPGQAIIDSNPQGAQFQVDGKSDPSWVTPFNVIGLSPGKHLVTVSKAGYTTEVRSVDVVSGSKSSLVLHLAPVNALVVVNSTPAGAEITLDGKSTGRVTPAQFAVEKGSHIILLRKQGFLDETTTADLGPGQNFQYAPVLKALGNAEDIRTVGKFNKLFGKGGESTAGMGTVTIHTKPKGAQVVINQHMLDKMSPVEMMMSPGNYVVDITLTGFKPIHKVISVEKSGKVVIDEILDRE